MGKIVTFFSIYSFAWGALLRSNLLENNGEIISIPLSRFFVYKNSSNTRETMLRANEEIDQVNELYQSLFKQKYPNTESIPLSYPTSEYMGEITMGTQQAGMKVIFDTGSGNLVVPLEECESTACRVRRVYDIFGSQEGKILCASKFDMLCMRETSKKLRSQGTTKKKKISMKSLMPAEGRRDETNIVFGTGVVRGVFAEDRVCLLPNKCATVRFVGGIEMSYFPFYDLIFDGILGLSPVKLSESSKFSILHNFLTSVSSQHQKFIFLFSHQKNKGKFMMGDLGPILSPKPFLPSTNKSNKSGDKFLVSSNNILLSPILWSPLVDFSYWKIRLEQILYSADANICERDCYAIFDTGTSNFAASRNIVRKIENFIINHQKNMSCELYYQQLPSLHLRIQNQIFTIEPSMYINVIWNTPYLSSPLSSPLSSTPQMSSSPLTSSPFSSLSSDLSLQCQHNFLALDFPSDEENVIVLGTKFFQKFLTVFDFHNHSIGLATLNASVVDSLLAD